MPFERTERTAVTLGRGQLGAASDCQALSLGWKFCHQKTPGLGRPSPSFPPHPVHPLGQNRSSSFSEDFFPASSCTTPLGLVLEADDDLLNPVTLLIIRFGQKCGNQVKQLTNYFF